MRRPDLHVRGRRLRTRKEPGSSMGEMLRRCLELLGPGQRSRWTIVIVLALVVSGLEVVGALLVFGLLARITSDASGFALPWGTDLRDVLPGVDESVLMVIVGGSIALFFVARGIAIIGQSYVQHRVAENAGARLSTRLLDGYLAMPYAFHLQRNSAELVRNSYDIVQQFSREALIPAVKLITHSLITMGLLGVLLWKSPVATLIALVVIGPFLWLLLRVVHPWVKRLGEVSQRMSKTSLQTLHESLAGWRDITLLGRQASFVSSFGQDRRRLARARYLRSTAKALPRVALETGLVLFILAFLGVTVVLQGGALQALPVLGLFGYVALRLQPSLNEILLALNSLKFVGPGIDLLYDDLRMFESSALRRRGWIEPKPLRDQLRVEAVTARYAGSHQDVLSDIDLTVRAGEFVGIVGPTGGGKSTLVDVMLGLTAPTRGRVLIDGADLQEHTAAWQASLGVVHQVVFLADTSVRRNIALGVPDEQIEDRQVEEAVRLAQLDPFVAALPEGLDTVIGERGIRVSGGQRQRLAIARALYRRPSVLFFDEGTSALDNATESQLMAALAALRGERTIIAVAHRLSTVHSCDRVVLIDGGRLLDVAPFAELASRHGELLEASDAVRTR